MNRACVPAAGRAPCERQTRTVGEFAWTKCCLYSFAASRTQFSRDAIIQARGACFLANTPRSVAGPIRRARRCPRLVGYRIEPANQARGSDLPIEWFGRTLPVALLSFVLRRA